MWRGIEAGSRRARSPRSLPYLRQASKVGILVIEGESKTEADPLKGNDAVLHLRHHGINAVKYRAIAEEDEIADALIAECRKLNANLLVMGSYGHSVCTNYCRAAPPIGCCIVRRSRCSSRTKIALPPFRSFPAEH